MDKRLSLQFKNYFKAKYGKTLSQEQLTLYQSFMLGKESDLLKVEEICGFLFDGQLTNREAFRYQYEFVYDAVPSEDQLDVFIAFRLGILKNIKILNEVCAKTKQSEQPGL